MKVIKCFRYSKIDYIHSDNLPNWCTRVCDDCAIKFLCFTLKADLIDIYYEDNRLVHIDYFYKGIWYSLKT